MKLHGTPTVSASSLTILAIILAATLTCTSAALRCYICNSIDEPECDANPPASLSADCSVGRSTTNQTSEPEGKHRAGIAEPKVCWIQRQEVQGTKVVVRHCGGPESTANATNLQSECYDRVGSKGVRSTYCKCKTDLCNSADRPQSQLHTASLVAMVAVGVMLTNLV